MLWGDYYGVMAPRINAHVFVVGQVANRPC